MAQGCEDETQTEYTLLYQESWEKGFYCIERFRKTEEDVYLKTVWVLTEVSCDSSEVRVRPREGRKPDV